MKKMHSIGQYCNSRLQSGESDEGKRQIEIRRIDPYLNMHVAGYGSQWKFPGKIGPFLRNFKIYQRRPLRVETRGYKMSRDYVSLQLIYKLNY